MGPKIGAGSLLGDVKHQSGGLKGVLVSDGLFCMPLLKWCTSVCIL